MQYACAVHVHTFFLSQLQNIIHGCYTILSLFSMASYMYQIPTYFTHYALQVASIHIVLSDSIRLSDCSVLGSVRTIVLEPGVRRAIHQYFNIVVSTIERAVNIQTYNSKCYNRIKIKVRNSYTVEYTNGGIQKFGFIISLPSSTVVIAIQGEVHIHMYKIQSPICTYMYCSYIWDELYIT